MAIDTVRKGIEKVIRKINGFDDTNVRTGDYAPIDSGKEKAVIIEYMPSTHGDSPELPARMRQFASSHNWRLRVYTRMLDRSSYTDLLGNVDNVITELNKYRKLDGTSNVNKSVVVSTSEVFVKQPEPYFLYMDVNLRVIESVDPNFSE